MKGYYCDHFVLPLPEEHRFPMEKYRRLRERVVAEGVIPEGDLRVPPAVRKGELALVHEAGYLRRVLEGRLSREEVRRIGFPWSPALVERSRRSVGGTIAAARAALEEGRAANLAGGTHHAFADHGEGYCVFNDVAVAARVLQGEGKVRRALVIDCDVHQGNGTAAIFAGDPSVFTFSLHGRRNYPFRKERSDLDVELEDGTSDDGYLKALGGALETVGEAAAGASLAFYVAGADPFVGDRLGRLALTTAGLRQRDNLVFEACHRLGLAVVVVMAGGYAPEVEDIVEIHHSTLRRAASGP